MYGVENNSTVFALVWEILTKTVNRYTEIHSVSDSQADTHQIHTHVRAVPSSRNGLLDTVFLKTFSAFVRERDAGRDAPMQHRTPWNPNPDRAKRSGAATAPAETRVMVLNVCVSCPVSSLEYHPIGIWVCVWSGIVQIHSDTQCFQPKFRYTGYVSGISHLGRVEEKPRPIQAKIQAFN